jgi:hypothetical protein
MGPGTCDARLVSNTSVSLKYTLKLSLRSPDQMTTLFTGRNAF